jgi:NADH-quinone oxidoreductase subunit G
LIILDSFEHLTTQQAQKTLPVAAFSETTGTLINYEGRAQRFYKVFAPQHACPDAWRSIGELFDQEFKTLDDLTRMMCARIPALKAWGAHAYHANFRLEHQKIPRETREFSGRTAMNAHISIHEAAPVRDPDTPLAHSMEGFHGQPPAELTTFFWAPGWNSNQALNKYQHPVGGEYKHDHLGIRLFEPHSKKLPSFFTYNLVLPVANKLESNKSYKIIPHLSIFGSEERSSLSPALCARLPQSYVGLSAQDAGELNLGNNQHLKLKLGDEDIILPVHIRQELSPGYILVPVGLRNITANLILPKTCTISACEAVS